MSDKKISQLTAATTPLAGSEVLPIVQGGATVQVSVDNLTAGKPVSMSNLTYTGTLTGSTGIANIGSGQIYKAADGKVGFGTTSPTQKVSLVGASFTGSSFNGQSFGDAAAERVRIGYKDGLPDTGLVPAQIVNNVSQLQIASRDTANGAILFFTGTGIPETFRIGNTGNVTVATGNLVIGTAGKGIDFSADPSAAGMTSELLDDYEEGTFTPNLGGDTTYTSQIGRYTKVGNKVTVQIVLTVNAINTPTSNAQIRGLPFTSANVTGFYQSGSVSWWDASNTAAYWIGCAIGSNTTVIDITSTTSGAQASANFPFAMFKSGTTIFATLTYFV